MNGSDATTFYNAGHKAYLKTAPGAALSSSLRFDFGGTTDIEKTMDNRQQATDIYDLHGRRITDTEGLKGIYIVNGRKVIFK